MVSNNTPANVSSDALGEQEPELKPNSEPESEVNTTQDMFADNMDEGIQCNDQEQDSLTLKPDTFTFDAEQDVYTLMFVSDYRSRHFFFGLGIFSLQIALLSLCVVNLLRDPDEGNLLKVPPYTPGSLIAAQALALLIVCMERDVITSVGMIRNDVGSNPTIIIKWHITNLLRFVEGFFVVVVTCIFIIQAVSVLELFLDFAAVAFVSELDNYAFYLADRGFIPIPNIQTKTKEITDMKMRLKPKEQFCMSRWTMTTLHKSSFVFLLIVLYTGFINITLKKKNGFYYEVGCNSFQVNFDAKHSFSYDFFTSTVCIQECPSGWKNRTLPIPYSSFNDVYYMGKKDGGKGDCDMINHRPVYYQRSKEPRDLSASGEIKYPGGRIHYCEKIESWVFTIDGVSKGVDGDDCSWLAKSRKTEALSLDEVEEEDWTIFTGIVEETAVDITCVDCKDEGRGETGLSIGCNYHGQCGDNMVCDCMTNWSGPYCGVCAMCTEFELLVEDGVTDKGLIELNATRYARLDNDRVLNGYFVNNDEDDIFEVYGHPVYYRGNYTGNRDTIEVSDNDNVIIYSGSQYLIWDLPNTCAGKTLVECLEGFHSAWDLDKINEPLYASLPTTQTIHAELKWTSFLSKSEDPLPFMMKCRNKSQAAKCEFLY